MPQGQRAAGRVKRKGKGKGEEGHKKSGKEGRSCNLRPKAKAKACGFPLFPQAGTPVPGESLDTQEGWEMEMEMELVGAVAVAVATCPAIPAVSGVLEELEVLDCKMEYVRRLSCCWCACCRSFAPWRFVRGVARSVWRHWDDLDCGGMPREGRRKRWGRRP
eukprot:scaffold23491_cov26-Tisochrysis_lutea.AAC.1